MPPNNMTVVETLEKIRDSLDYLILLQEMRMIADTAAAHKDAVQYLTQRTEALVTRVRELGLNKPKDIPEEDVKKAQSQMAEEASKCAHDSEVFTFLYQNEMKVAEIINKKLLPIMTRKYPLLKEKPKIPGPPTKAETPQNCDICGKPAVIGVDGKAACKIHYADIFKKDEQPKEVKAFVEIPQENPHKGEKKPEENKDAKP